MHLFFVVVASLVSQLQASLGDDTKLSEARIALQNFITPDGISLKDLNTGLQPVKKILHNNPEKIIVFSGAGLGATLWAAALRTEKGLSKKGTQFDTLKELENFILPDCATLKKFEEYAEGIAFVREIDQKLIEDALLVRLAGVDALAENAGYFLSGVNQTDRALSKKRLKIFLEALKPCADFFKNDSLYSEHPDFSQKIRTLLSAIFFSGDEGFIADIRALQIPDNRYPLEALANKEVAAKLFGIKGLDGRYKGHENMLILEMIKYNLKQSFDTSSQWKMQRAWIKEELKKFTYDSFSWYYRELLENGDMRETNLLSPIIQREDAEMLAMLPLKPGAPILKKRAYYDFKKGASTSYNFGKSLYGDARSVEWIKKLRALGVEGDMSDAGDVAAPVLLEDLAQSMEQLQK